ncbi:MAG: hypothetical protein ABSE55_07770 [Terracidiphilus sp.]|jgi:predicted GH43/DUF377 family glycosyl hydrolase
MTIIAGSMKRPSAQAISRRSFVVAAAAAATCAPLAGASQQAPDASKRLNNPQDAKGMFAWQFPSADNEATWRNQSFSIDRWWGDFPHDLPDQMDMFADNPWAIGPFTKHKGNPVLAPTPGAWDSGHFSGGVHNGSIIVKDGIFYYLYRGERPIDIKQNSEIDYICDIGVATSKDGIHFTKDDAHSPFFRKGADRVYSYEDVNVVRSGDTYYLYCNQWLWERQGDTSVNGITVSTSTDLLSWTKHGILFPNSKRIHRNGVVLQSPENEAIKVNGKYVMYIDDGLIAYSEDLLHWESAENSNAMPGGECCFALGDYDAANPDNLVLFTGGAHTGHFYGVGEILISKADVTKSVRYLPRSPLFAEVKYPFENGFAAEAPHKPVSSFADCIFFNGLTRHDGKWWVYYGGSEYYTCLATAPAAR